LVIHHDRWSDDEQVSVVMGVMTMIADEPHFSNFRMDDMGAVKWEKTREWELGNIMHMDFYREAVLKKALSYRTTEMR
jgi:hypothetical protein